METWCARYARRLRHAHRLSSRVERREWLEKACTLFRASLRRIGDLLQAAVYSAVPAEVSCAALLPLDCIMAEKMRASEEALEDRLDRSSAFFVFAQETHARLHGSDDVCAVTEPLPLLSAPGNKALKRDRATASLQAQHTCKTCQDVFMSRNELMKHLRHKHEVRTTSRWKVRR